MPCSANSATSSSMDRVEWPTVCPGRMRAQCASPASRAQPLPQRAPPPLCSALRDAAALGLPAVRQAHDLPPVGGAGELEGVVAAVAEARAEMERVVGPDRGQVAGDADLGVVEPFDPLIALRRADGLDEPLRGHR